MKRVKPKRGKGTARERVLARYRSASLFRRLDGKMFGIWIRRRGMWVILDSNFAKTASQAWSDAARRLERK